MKYLQAVIWWALPVLLVAGLYYAYAPGIAVPCAAPIHYRIGTVDPRFGVSENTFKSDIAQAGDIWGHAIDKQLFVYDPEGSLTINLVYDDRQAITQKEQSLNTVIDQTTETAQSIKQQYTTLKANYQSAQTAYNADLAAYNSAQSSYNDEVNYWNARGGAPDDVYAKLSAQKSSLLSERQALEDKRQGLNQMADEINAFIDKYNLLVSHINAAVDTINNDGLAGTEFEEGVYISDKSGKRINVYQFQNKTDLLRVLAHEMGHALQLEHNSNPDSIMSPLNQSESLALSAQDLEELKTECKI